MTFLNAATVPVILAVACPLLICGLAFWVVCAVSGKRDLTLVEPDPTPHEDEPEEIAEEIQVDEPMTRMYTEPGWTMFLGGLVHVDCIGPFLRDETPPCAGCAVHLDHVLTGAA